jgi:hypothetical protein
VANPNPSGRRKVGVPNKMSSARVERALREGNIAHVDEGHDARLRLSELSPVERMKYRCKHRRLAERWRDMRLEGSKLDGADAGALDEGRKLGLFEDMVEGSDLGCEGNLPLST